MIEILEAVTKHIPFSYLSKDEFAIVEKSMQISYYPQETTLIESNKSVEKLFVIIKGNVKAFNDDELIDVYHANDLFGGIELIENRVSKYKYVVTEELICFEMPKEQFLELCTLNMGYKSYFITSLAQRIDSFQEKNEYSVMGDLMVAKLDNSLYREACIVPQDMDIIDALKMMQIMRVSCVVVENSDGYGIVTDTDYRNYILARESQNFQKIGEIQTKPIIAATEGELLFNILLLMTEKSIKHLLITDENKKVVGVLELINLLSFFSNQSHLIVVQMQKAKSVEDVIKAGKRVHTMIAALHARGVKSRYIAKLVSEINRKMYAKLYEMVFPVSWHEKCALILLGSEGRAEQILHTDQDNALIIEDGFAPENAQKYALEFIEILDMIGFPRCEGEIMIINQKWRKEQSEYKKDIDHWIEHPSYDGFMDMAIFFDSSVVAGKSSLHEQIKEYLINKTSNNKIILAHFARAIESFESPLGIFSQFVSHSKVHKNEIDIKKGALFALIHGMRALALEFGIDATNTNLRIKELTNRGFMSREDAKNLMEALEVVNRLRLQAQLEKITNNQVLDNYISVAALTKLERDLLKEALKEVNHFKKLVGYHFHLSKVG